MTAIGPGTRVKCIKEFESFAQNTGADFYGPRVGDNLTVSSVFVNAGKDYLQFAKWPRGGWLSVAFRPIDQIDDLAALIRHASNPDAPAGVPSLPEPEYVVVRR